MRVKILLQLSKYSKNTLVGKKRTHCQRGAKTRGQESILLELQVCADNMEAPDLLQQVAAFALQVTCAHGSIETRLFINNEFVESKSGEVCLSLAVCFNRNVFVLQKFTQPLSSC